MSTLDSSMVNIALPFIMKEFHSPLGDILAHLPMHGQHHRGQVNADLRAAGITPPAIDFIAASRAGALD